jgi:hypothetical protein
MAGKRFFIYAPPLKGVRESKRKDRQEPYKDANPQHRSVYYYWWEYLRRNEAYRRTCERKGKGPLSKLYRDFGDVYGVEFWEWWKAHVDLFCEPAARRIGLAEAGELPDENTLIVRVPLENKLSLNLKSFRLFMEPYSRQPRYRRTVSRAIYPVASKPHLPTLHQHLLVWDARQDNPALADWEFADLTGVRINQVVEGLTLSQHRMSGIGTEKAERVLRRRKQLAVQRHLRIAEQYIENAGKGMFPLRHSR